MDEWRRSGQIPAFGDWDKANEMPITQYFESARQAGLIRHTCSSGDFDLPLYPPPPPHVHFNKTKSCQDLLGPPRKVINRGRERSSESHVKEQKKQGKVYDVTTNGQTRPKLPKPVDEDLYKIPPHLLRSSKRKKLPGFFSCLVPACAS